MRKLFRLKIYRRLAFTFCVLAFLTVTGITAILYARFSAVQTREAARLSLAMLRQTSFAASTVHDQVRYVSDQLYTTPEVMSLLFARRIDRYADYKASLKAQILQNAYPFIDYIGIYNGALDRYWNTRLVSADNEAELLARVRGSRKTAYVDCFPHVLHDAGSATRGTSHIISFILYPNYRFTPEAALAIVINVSESYLSGILRGMSVDPWERLFIMDAGGRIMASKEEGLFLSAQGGEGYYAAMGRLVADQGSFQETIGGKRCLVTFLEAPDLGWRFVSIRPLASLMPHMEGLRRTALAAAFLILVLGIGLSLLAARFVYEPLDALVSRWVAVPSAPKATVDEVSLLESALAQTRRLCLKYILRGSAPEEPVVAALLVTHERECVSLRPRVCVLRVDGYVAYCAGHARKERDAHQAALVGALSGAFGAGVAQYVLSMEEDETVLLLGADGAGDAAAVAEGIREAQRVMAERCHLSLSAGIGPAAVDAEGIRASYRAAREAVDQRFFLGRGAVVDAETRAARASDPYPQETERRLREALGTGREDEVERRLAELRACLSRVTRERALSYARTLSQSIERQFSPLLGGTGEMPDTDAMETLDDVMEALRGYCAAVGGGARTHGAHRGDDIVERVTRCAEERYQEPALNLDAAARAVGRSPAYVGKLFKRATGASFAAYLNGVRMRKARELLASTDLPVGAIAERIGVSNATYLFTLFKKAYAETPIQYRDRLHAAGRE